MRVSNLIVLLSQQAPDLSVPPVRAETDPVGGPDRLMSNVHDRHRALRSCLEGDIEQDRLLLLLLFNTKRMPSGPPSMRATITWMEV